MSAIKLLPVNGRYKRHSHAGAAGHFQNGAGFWDHVGLKGAVLQCKTHGDEYIPV